MVEARKCDDYKVVMRMKLQVAEEGDRIMTKM